MTNCWQIAAFSPRVHAAGVCVIEVGAVPAGARERAPDRMHAAGFEARILTLITPGTERSSHYFRAHARNIRLDDAGVTDIIRKSILATFDQDKVVLEAQQSNADAVGSTEPGLVLGIDAGPVRGRRLLAAAREAG